VLHEDIEDDYDDDPDEERSDEPNLVGGKLRWPVLGMACLLMFGVSKQDEPKLTFFVTCNYTSRTFTLTTFLRRSINLFKSILELEMIHINTT
jgi:hypothetical protein